MTMWEIVSWALTTRNSGCLCTYPHCVMTMRQRGDDHVGNCALGIDNEEFKLLVSIPTLCDDNAATGWWQCGKLCHGHWQRGIQVVGVHTHIVWWQCDNGVMTMWEIVCWALTTINSCCLCPYPHCVMTMRQLCDDNVGNCVMGIDNDEFMLFVSIPTLCDYNAATGWWTCGKLCPEPWHRGSQVGGVHTHIMW